MQILNPFVLVFLLSYATQLLADDDLFERLGDLHWISQGNQGDLVYVVVDPDCFSCWHEYSYIHDELRPKRTIIRWIPVSSLRPERSESDVQASLEEGDIDSLMHTKLKPTKSVPTLAIENHRKLRELGVRVLPMLVSKSKTVTGFSKGEIRTLIK